MTTRVRIALFSVCSALALATYAGRASAVDSDRLVVTDLANGTVLFDQTIPEPGPGQGEGQLVYGAPMPLPAPPVPGVFVLFLTEPAGEPLDNPPIFVPGTTDIISDIVFATFFNPALPDGVTFISDGDPNFAQWFNSALLFPFQVLPENGQLQDVTPFLGPTPNLRIEVQSDAVVPEPGTLLLLGSGLVGIAAARRRRS